MNRQSTDDWFGRAVLADLGPTLALAATPLVIFAAHLLYGATLDLPALILAALLSSFALVALMHPGLRRDLDGLRPVALPAVLFLLALLWAVWSLTPWVVGGPHPVWAWADLPPASTLDRSGTILEMIKLLGLSAAFVLGCLSGATSLRARRAVWIILGLGAGYALVCLSLFATDRYLMHQGARFSAGFASANVAGALFGLLLVLTVALAARQATRQPGRAAVERITALSPLVGAGLLFLFCLVLTASRGATGATFLALSVVISWIAIGDRRSRWPLALFGFGLVVVTTLLATTGSVLFLDRLGGMAGPADGRTVLLDAHWRAFLTAPVVGQGLGSFSEVNNQIMTSSDARVLSETVVLHNAYLQTLLEAGLVGAIPLFAAVCVILVVTVWRAVGRSRPSPLLVGLIAGSVLVLVHAALDVTLNTPSIAALWAFLLGLSFAFAQARRSRS